MVKILVKIIKMALFAAIIPSVICGLSALVNAFPVVTGILAVLVLALCVLNEIKVQSKS